MIDGTTQSSGRGDWIVPTFRAMTSSLKRKCSRHTHARTTHAVAEQMRGTVSRVDDELGCKIDARSQQKMHILNLPVVVLQVILSFLPGDGEGGVHGMRRVCKDWKSAVDEAADSMWEEVFKRQFGPILAQWSHFDQQLQPAIDCEAGTSCRLWQRRFKERVVAGQNWAKGQCKQWHLPSDTDEAEDAAAAAFAASNVCVVNVQHCLLVVGMFSGGVEAWDLTRQQRIAVMNGHTGYIRAIDVDPHQKFVLTASEDTTARVWNLSTGECTAVVRHSEPVADVWWVNTAGGGLTREPIWRNGRLELGFCEPSGHAHGKMPWVLTATRLLDEEEDTEFLLRKFPEASSGTGASGPVHGSCARTYSKAYMFDQGTGVLALPGAPNHLKLHHVLSNADLAVVRLDLEGHVKDVFFGHSSVHGWQLIIGSDRHEVGVWDLATQTRVSHFCHTSVEEMTMFALNQNLFCLTASVRPASPESSIRTAHFRVWDAFRGERMGVFLETEFCGTPCDALEFEALQPGKPNVTVVSAGADGRVTMWTLPSGDVVELPHRMEMGEQGYLVADSTWRWFVVGDHAGVHVFDFL